MSGPKRCYNTLEGLLRKRSKEDVMCLILLFIEADGFDVWS